MEKLNKRITRRDHSMGGSVHDHNHSMGGSVHDHNHSMGGSVHDHNHSMGGSVHDHNHSMGGSVHDHNHSIGGMVHDHANTIEGIIDPNGNQMRLTTNKGGLSSRSDGKYQWGYLKAVKKETNESEKSRSDSSADAFSKDYENDTMLFVNNKNLQSIDGELERDIYFKIKTVPITLLGNVQIDIAIAYDLDYVNNFPDHPKRHIWVNGQWKLVDHDAEV